MKNLKSKFIKFAVFITAIFSLLFSGVIVSAQSSGPGVLTPSQWVVQNGEAYLNIGQGTGIGTINVTGCNGCGGGGGGVSTLNTLLGDINLIEGQNVTIGNVGNDIQISANFTQQGKYMISGGAIWSGTGLTYNVSIISYFFNGFKTGTQTNVTLDPSDPLENRLDAIVIDEIGTVSVITGDPSASPVTPPIPEDQLLVQYILVIAGSTEPVVEQDAIYLDSPTTNWTNSTYTTGAATGTINFAGTSAPKQGINDIEADTDLRLGARFVRSSAIDLQEYTMYSVWVRFTAPVATNKALNVRFENTAGTLVGNTVNLFNYGLNRNIVNTWQLVIVPVPAFGNITTVKGLKAIMAGGTVGVKTKWDMDFMLLTNGSTPQANVPTLSFYRNGTGIAAQSGLNLIEGLGGVGISGANDPTNGRVNYTINAFGGDALSFRDSITKVSQILRPFTYAAGFSFDVDTAPVAILETSNPFIDGEAVTFYEGTVSSVTFTGSGLDDMTSPSGTFTGTYPTTYTVTVASTGTPDTFDWTDGTNSGTGVPMSTSPITLSNGIEISFAADTGHTLADEWEWIYSSSSVGTGTLIHQETGAVLTAQFYSGITGDPSTATYVVGTTSGEQSGLNQYLGNSTFTNGDSVISISTDYVTTTGTITSVPGADNYIISAASGFDQYVILTDADNTKFGGIIASTSTPLNANAQAGFVTSDDILGLGVDGSGILFDNTDNSEYGFSGILNENGITGGIRLNQEGITTTLDLSKTGLVFNLNDGSLTSNFSVDFGNISLYATHPSNTNMTGITIDAMMEAIEIGNLGSKAKISIDNETDGIISLNTSSSPSDPSIQINAQTDKIRFNQAYTFPLSAGSSGQVLALDGSGNLEWTTPVSSTSPITIGTSGNTLYSSGLSGTGEGDTGIGNNIFLGLSAGSSATNASYSNFFGYQAGNGATNASNSNFFGVNTGNGATSADNSNFFGNGAGHNATNASNSNFFGYQAGYYATGAFNSNFFGNGAGNGATGASYSNFFGVNTGYGATSASNSNFFGVNTGYGATSASNSNFLGLNAGYGATSASNSNFLGNEAGYGATSASNSNFFGYFAGREATNADQSIFIGTSAGYQGTNADHSVFVGAGSGGTASDADYSVFIGANAGLNATNARVSSFIGQSAGAEATNAVASMFFGSGAGDSAVNASKSIFIGNSAGNSDTVNNSTTNYWSILIGDNTSTGGFSNSIAIGKSATNTASNQLMIGNIGNSYSKIDTVIINGTGGIQVPVGTTGERSVSQGMIRYNTTTSKFEGYDGSTWVDLN